MNQSRPELIDESLRSHLRRVDESESEWHSRRIRTMPRTLVEATWRQQARWWVEDTLRTPGALAVAGIVAGVAALAFVLYVAGV